MLSKAFFLLFYANRLFRYVFSKVLRNIQKKVIIGLIGQMPESAFWLFRLGLLLFCQNQGGELCKTKEKRFTAVWKRGISRLCLWAPR